MPRLVHSLTRHFFEVLERALKCHECKFHSHLLRDQQWKIMQLALIGELVQKMRPGEWLIRRQNGKFQEWAFFMALDNGQPEELGVGGDERTAMLMAFDILDRE